MILDSFSDHPVVDGFGAADLESFGSVLNPLELSAEESIFDEGMATRGLVLLSQGVVEVRKQTDSGRPHVITTLNAQTVLGEIEFMSGSTASASVVAKTAVTALVLDREAFQDWLSSNTPCAGKLARNIGRVLARRLEETNLALIKLVKSGGVSEFDAFRDKLVTEWNF
ncbi:MAG: Crp/Fnr family transcriptional regulator [Myxococcota bacterium]